MQTQCRLAAVRHSPLVARPADPWTVSLDDRLFAVNAAIFLVTPVAVLAATFFA